MSAPEEQSQKAPLARRLGVFDATMLVMGGMIGSGIFMNPALVARQVHTPVLVLGTWVLGGFVTLIGAFIYAELANRLPRVGGQYAYLREAFHPLFGFLYGWVLLLVVQTGGMAAVTVTFASYFVDLTSTTIPVSVIALITLTVLTAANCVGVRSGSNVQSALMLLKLLAILTLVIAGLSAVMPVRVGAATTADQKVSVSLLSSFGAAIVPVLFAYGGWQTACFVAGELKDPRRTLPRALLLGVAGVIALYSAVNLGCVKALGVENLAHTDTPASAVMRLAFGTPGAKAMALGIAVSTLGFLSQSVLTAPRVYFAMAEDGVFFRQLAWVHPRTRVPVFAIVLQSAWTLLILLSGTYAQILNYVTAMDWIFFGLTASCLFVLRRSNAPATGFRMPLHPVSTGLFCLVCWAVVANTIYRYPEHTLVGMAILISGIPVYFLWQKFRVHE
jgi:basic amino acid/polyamine antiporter, APA family